jgi:hypothetical protein
MSRVQVPIAPYSEIAEGIVLAIVAITTAWNGYRAAPPSSTRAGGCQTSKSIGRKRSNYEAANKTETCLVGPDRFSAVSPAAHCTRYAHRPGGTFGCHAGDASGGRKCR